MTAMTIVTTGPKAAVDEVARAPIDQLPPTYRDALQSATTGQVVGPLRLDAGGTATFAVVKVTGRQEAGEYTLEDVREDLVRGLQQQEMMMQLVEELRGRVHVEVLP